MVMKDFNEFVLQCLEDKNIDLLKNELNKASEQDIIDTLGELSLENQAIVYRLLPKDKALDVFEQLETSDQERLIGAFTHEQAIQVIDGLDPDDRVRLLDEMPAKVAKKMLAALSPGERAITNLLMGYEPETAGRIMTPEFVGLSRKMKVSDALAKIKKIAPEKETIYSLFITNETKVLEGVTSLRRLFLADPDDIVENLMLDDFTKVSTDTDQEEVARLLQKRDLLAIPVTDKENRLVGIITVDDAMDILEDEATEDMLNKAGLADSKGKRGERSRSERLVKGSIWSVLRIRLPFLLITLVGGVLAGTVIDAFEETLATIIAVAIFIPVIMDMGGSVGVQSSTIFLRGVLLEHLNTKKIWKHVGREVYIGFIMGVIVGILCGITAFVWQGPIAGTLDNAMAARLGLAVGLSLLATMMLSAFIGFMIPYILLKLNIDQAAATEPIITSIKDISGLFIYFCFVALFMSQLL